MIVLPPRVFVTGTDTEVGKTVVTAALAAASGARALKPVATGVEQGFGEDAELLALATGSAPTGAYRWRQPVSPHRAAELEGGPAGLPELLAWIRREAGARAVVEGVGGWRVPITWDYAVEDLAVALGWPVVVVAANRLGVLNHTLLTVEAVQRRLPVAAVILNDMGQQDASVGSNLADLRRLVDAPVWPFPHLPVLDRESLRAAGAKLLVG